MATVGQTLPAPEEGWRRYDDTDSRIKYSSEVSNLALSGQAYGNECKVVPLNDIVSFKFYGSKLRIIGIYDPDNQSDIISITIDGFTENFSERKSPWTNYVICYEKLNLDIGIHTITIKNLASVIYPNNFIFDCIDIDSMGYLTHPILTQRTKVEDMLVGDCIPCRYTASSATAGIFSELGTCIAAEIPIAGTATPDGLFYFIKVDKGILIADRVVQTGISWNILNASRYIEGIVSTYINPTIVSTNIDTSILYTPSYLPNLFVASLLNQLNFSFKSAPPSLVYVQFEYPESHLLTSIQVFASLNAAGMEPLSNFSIKGSISGDFTDEQLIYSGKYTTLGAWQTFNFLSTKKFKKFRFYVDTWNINNGGGGANIEAIIPYFSDYKIRSLSGGNAYLGTDGKVSLTDHGLGAYPNNEWDMYVSNFEDVQLNWNAGNASLVKDCIIGGGTGRQFRGPFLLNGSWYGKDNVKNVGGGITNSYASPSVGFRPVLEYPDDYKCTNIWY
jgi:hypothetical protein